MPDSANSQRYLSHGLAPLPPYPRRDEGSWSGGLRGIVEVDETYVGGKTRGMGRGYRGNKAIAIGAVQRGGLIRLQVIKNADKATLHKFIADNTDPATEAIYTDQLPAYIGVADATLATRASITARKSGCVATFTRTALRASGACLNARSSAPTTMLA